MFEFLAKYRAEKASLVNLALCICAQKLITCHRVFLNFKVIQITGIDDDNCSIHTVNEKIENDVRNAFDIHVPIKENNQLPYMKRNIRKAIYNKNCHDINITKNNNSTWENTCRVGIKQIR